MKVEASFLVHPLDHPTPPKKIKIFSSLSILPKREQKIFSNYSFILKQRIVDFLHYNHSSFEQNRKMKNILLL